MPTVDLRGSQARSPGSRAREGPRSPKRAPARSLGRRPRACAGPPGGARPRPRSGRRAGLAALRHPVRPRPQLEPVCGFRTRANVRGFRLLDAAPRALGHGRGRGWGGGRPGPGPEGARASSLGRGAGLALTGSRHSQSAFAPVSS